MTIYKLKQNIIYKKEKWDILGLSSDFKMISNKHEKILDCIVKILLFNKNLLPLFDKYIIMVAVVEICSDTIVYC